MTISDDKHQTNELSTFKIIEQSEAVVINREDLGAALCILISDIFSLHVKTKNFHWHMKGRHFREYHLLLDDQATQLYDIIDLIAERARKIGQPTICSLEQMVKLTRIKGSNSVNLSAEQMLFELHQDNQLLTSYMRITHKITADANDVATTSLLEEWIDQAEERTWFLGQTIS